MARRSARKRARETPRNYLVADVAPLDVDGVRTLAVGSGIWLVALLMLLPFYDSLRENDRVWWLWTCIAGFGLGLCGMQYCKRLRRRREQRDALGEA